MIEDIDHIADIPAYIFGEGSYVASAEGVISSVGLAAQQSSIIFVGLVALLAALFLVWINYWSAGSDNHRALFRFLGYHRGDYSSKLEEFSHSFSNYLWSGVAMSVFAVWIAVIAYAGVDIETNYSLCVYMLLGLLLLYVYQFLFIYIAGLLVACEEFMRILLHLKGIYFSIVSLVTIPMVLCYSLTYGGVNIVFSYLLIAQCVALVVLLLFETFMLFVAQKVSLLHTILYLCAVEIFPITLIWGIFSSKL